MATQSEIQSYQEVIDGLSTVAFAQIKALLQQLDQSNPIAFRDALLATYPELLAPYMGAAADVAAQWYLELRAGSSVTSKFVPVLAQPAPREQLEAGLRYSLSPLFAPEKFLGSDILTLLAGFSQKMIANSGRETIVASAVADGSRVGYQRVPRAGCCAFCGLLAARGAVYRSSASAGGVVGRGVEASATAGKGGGQGKGLRARGAQNLGDGFHDMCRCVVTPVFRGAENDYLEYVAKHFDDIDSKAVREIGTEDGSLKSRLAAIRQLTGSK